MRKSILDRLKAFGFASTRAYDYKLLQSGVLNDGTVLWSVFRSLPGTEEWQVVPSAVNIFFKEV